MNTECANIYGSFITPTEICTDTFEGMNACHLSSHPNRLQNFTSYINYIHFLLLLGPLAWYQCICITYLLCELHWHPLLAVDPDKCVSTKWYTFLSFQVPFLNFQAFRMAFIISSGRITFHDFTCLVFQGDISGPLVYLENNGNYTQVASYCLFLGEAAIANTLLVTPGSTNT